MSAAVLCFVVAGVLIVVGAALRELEVPGFGAIGRGRRARLLTATITVSTLCAAALTLQRLIVMTT